MTTFQNYPAPGPEDELGTPWRAAEEPDDRQYGCVVLAITSTYNALGTKYLLPPPGVERAEAREVLANIITEGWQGDYDDILRVSADELLITAHSGWTGGKTIRIIVAEHAATTR